ncbi:glycosyltransferase [Cellulosimicrobium sp. Marseille-Q4280]|uniref:glycosyltransferase family protein n=1 Tax=Cellulosimicrobium sp. Marseille-Q4280 TaxID=2937992 RepID=UPI00203FA3B5|nr:glycosyltransferase [Cellulosimicrobium sp. Marseille-Q4280]
MTGAPEHLAGRGHRTRRRIALYSHDTQGLGHVRRTSLLARAVVEADPDVDVLLLSGAAEATSLPLPARTEVVTLPGITKDPATGYGPRRWGGDLGGVVDVRAGVLDGALAAFDPDVLVVDKVPLGVGGELRPALERLRARGRTACVLGLRDVLDVPEVAVREWDDQRSTSVVARFYDEVWVYGDARVYDPLVEYALPDVVARRTVFTGYLGHGRSVAAARVGSPADHRAARAVAVPDVPYVLCLVGGGQDGAELARSFARTALPDGVRGVLVTGPYLPAATRAVLRRAALARPDLEVHAFVRDVVPLVEGARAVVTMGGYNSVCEVLASRRPALVVPRTRPRAEQLVRARRLAELGLVDVLDGDPAPERLASWLRGVAGGDGTAGRAARRADGAPSAVEVDLDGLARVPALVARLVARARSADVTPDVTAARDARVRTAPLMTAPTTTAPTEEDHRATA